MLPERINIPQTLHKLPIQSLQKIHHKLFSLKHQNSVFLKQEINNLQKIITIYQQILNNIRINKHNSLKKIQWLRIQANNLSIKVNNKSLQWRNQNKEQQFKNQIQSMNQQYIDLCHKRLQISKSLNINQLKKLNIKDKTSAANDIFKWILVVVYKQSLSRYYWPNFRKQAFQKDNGLYFIDKIGKIQSLSLKYQQKIMTEGILQQLDAVIESPQYNTIKEQGQKLLQIIKLYYRGYKLGKDLLKLDEQVGINKQQTQQIKKQLQQMEKLLNVTQIRISVFEQHVQILDEMVIKVEEKLAVSVKMINNGNKIMQKLFKQNNQYDRSSVKQQQNEQGIGNQKQQKQCIIF